MLGWSEYVLFDLGSRYFGDGIETGSARQDALLAHAVILAVISGLGAIAGALKQTSLMKGYIALSALSYILWLGALGSFINWAADEDNQRPANPTGLSQHQVVGFSALFTIYLAGTVVGPALSGAGMIKFIEGEDSGIGHQRGKEMSTEVTPPERRSTDVQGVAVGIED